MSRSLKVRSDCIKQAKLAIQRNGFHSQRALAEELGLALSTIGRFLNGKTVDYAIFVEICRKLALDWRDISDFGNSDSISVCREFSPAEERELPFPQGLVALDSPFYVERSGIESLCYETVVKLGSLIRIKAPKMMGKTSLMTRILAHAAHHNYQTVYLDLSSVDRGILTNLDKFLRWFCVLA